MAEFGPKATELSAPQGAGATPIAPVKEQFIDTSIMPIVSDVANIFVKGIGESRKAEAEAMKASVVGSYISDQERINSAVSSGQMRPDIAATRSRALFGQYMASNAAYADDIHKARVALSGGSELASIEDAVKVQANIQNTRISNAQSRGATVYNWMDKETLDKTLYSSELAVQQERDMDRRIKIQTENRAQGAESRVLADREAKVQSTQMITELAGANIDRMSSLIKNISDKVATGMPYEEATLVLAREFAQVEGAIQSVAGVNPELASPYRSLFSDLKALGEKSINPKTKSETSKAMYDEIINRHKLTAITTDPKMKAVVVANELLGGNAVTALNSTAPITDFIARMSNTDINGVEFVPQVVGNPTVEKDVLKFLESSIKKVNEGSFKDTPKAEKEAINSVNQILKQTGDLMKTGKVDAQKMGDLSTFFASPEYGRFASTGKLDRDAAAAAKMAWQTSYVPAVQQSVGSRIDTVEQSFSGGGGIPKRAITDLVNVRYTGSGITFDIKAVTGTPLEEFEKGKQRKAVDDLNSVKAGINRLIHIGAHMEGHTDYAKYWEENKYVYLPQIYSARAGVVVNGYKSKGGVASDPSNWEKVQP